MSGHLLTEILGRAYSDAQIYATVDLFPGTGFNGGRTTVTGSARSLTGYDIAGGKTGTENFSLVFADVPFTFNQRIDVTLSLTVSASVDAGTGAVAASIADYGSTMTWAGLSHVLDQRGTPLLHYAALSAESGFNFAPVPEPSHLLLVTSGLLVVLCRRTKCLRR